MTLQLVLDIIAICGGVIGAVGGTVGIVTSIRSSRREEQKEIDENNDYGFLASFMAKQLEVGRIAGQIFIELEIGSTEWRRAEKMVERGILERGLAGRGYRLRGFFDAKTSSSDKSPRIKSDAIRQI
jgi:hypothetical protein